MCGIVGYVGPQQAVPILLEGLTRLEHRGYDSAGIAVLGGSGLKVAKRAGRVRDLSDALPKRFAGKIGVGHTRWATHGPANDVNAHPHTDGQGLVAVVHNGIIDNAAALRPRLSDYGVELVSDTDTEVLAHLVARSEADTLEGKVSEALAAIEGTYGLAVVHADFPDRLVVARNGSPLLIGVGEQEMFVASDLAAIVRHTTTVAHLDDGEMATLTASGFTTYGADLQPSRPSARRPSTSTRRRTTRATTTPSCTRRCSSSLPLLSGCCGAVSTSASVPRTSAGSTWTPARPGRSAGSRSSAAARPTTSGRWAPR